jgi:hypothetical protein
LLFQRLRTLGLQGTELAHATAGTIRQRLLKIGAMVPRSARAGFTFGSLRHFRFSTSSHRHIVLWQGWYPKRVKFTTSPTLAALFVTRVSLLGCAFGAEALAIYTITGVYIVWFTIKERFSIPCNTSPSCTFCQER